MRFLSLIAATILVFGSGAMAEELTAKPLPGNKPCSYPRAAQEAFVAGSVRFSAQVKADGTIEAVEVRTVPLPGFGFEGAIEECVSRWRFEPAPAGHAGLRRHDGRLKFRLDPPEEGAIEALLQSLATAWNTGDLKALDELAHRADDGPRVPAEDSGALHTQLQAEPTLGSWRMQMEPEFEHIRFLRPDLATVRQPYRRTSTASGAGQGASTDASALDAMVAKGKRGWRFVRVSSADVRTSAAPASPTAGVWPSALRIQGQIREPRQTKRVPPRYPEAAKYTRIQGV